MAEAGRAPWSLPNLREGRVIPGNTAKDPSTLGLSTPSSQIYTISADEMAWFILDSPIINTALSGAFSGLTKTLTLHATLKAVMKRFSGDLGRENALIARKRHKRMAARLS
jgi:Pyruvate/2-oxoacid:ferredoxin oxidoreductase gamma subunit